MSEFNSKLGRLTKNLSSINLHAVKEKYQILMSNYLCNAVPIFRRSFVMLAVLLVGFQFAWASHPIEDAGFAFSETSLELLENASAQVSDFGFGQEAVEYSSSKTDKVTSDYDDLYLSLAVIVGVLFLVVLLLVFVSANLINLIRVREGKEAFSLKGTIAYSKELALNPFIATGGNLVVFVIGLVIIVPIARGVGLSQGYQPDQPIWFSHAIHAGQYEIDCQYCHTGASKGKNAWIPSTNVCMNCHKAIKEGSISGEKEIAKIYQSYETNTPIEWVRIHNLPDLSYFNHQQHVVAGGLECQTCHGPIEEMDVVYQWAPLSMGWCINCHRETEVNPELYEKLGRTDVHTVEDIGGLQCARCHY